MKLLTLLTIAVALACGCEACEWSAGCLAVAAASSAILFIAWSLAAELHMLATVLGNGCGAGPR